MGVFDFLVAPLAQHAESENYFEIEMRLLYYET